LPRSLGGSTVSIFLYVNDVDLAFNQAVASGAKVEMPVTDMFWGDRCGRLTDPFGHSWSMATHQEDVAPEEMRRRAQAVSGLNQFASHLHLKIESRRA
jgi:PhnB protein